MTETATRDLDTTTVVLDALVAARQTADRAEANLLGLAVHYVDLHPVTPHAPAATWTDRSLEVFPTGTPTGPGAAVNKVERARLAGDGTPGIAEYAVEELAAALNVGYHTGLSLVSDAVELCYRLPKLWALVQDGHLQAWKARTVATETTHLSREAAGFVDTHLATTARRNKLPGPGGIRALVHQALLRCDPDTAAAVEQATRNRRGVWFDNRESVATTQLTATLDTTDALALDATLTDLATLLGRLGDPTGIDIRRAHALGILADPQHALNLLTHTHTDTDTETDTGTNRDSGGDRDGATDAAPATGAAAGVGVVDESTPTVRTAVTGWRPTRPRAVLYVHVSAADLATGTGGAWIEKLGPLTPDLLPTWLPATNSTGTGTGEADGPHSGPVGSAGSRGFGGFTVRPVLDLNAHRVCDAHGPPPVMREQVILRDQHCVFPGCLVDARDCDLDHIIPYLPLEEGGPSGQTHPDALACLCRRHHRLKTFTAWTYHRTTHGRYQWTSPHGHTYLT